MEQLGIFERTGRILEGLEGIFSEDALPNFLMFSAAAWVLISFDADWFVLLLIFFAIVVAMALLLAYVGPLLAIGLFVTAFSAAVLIEGSIMVRRLAARRGTLVAPTADTRVLKRGNECRENHRRKAC